MNHREFWTSYQPGLRVADTVPDTKAFFEQVSAQRYALEPHIPDVVDFERWSGLRVLEAGCGIGTDGARFATAGAHYTGLDFSPSALSLARGRFTDADLSSRFVSGSVTRLPFEDESFDLVFSHGVIHHVSDTDGAVREFHRVLKPGGRILVMLYHRRSFNYYFTIMTLRRALAAVLVLPYSVKAVSALTGEPEAVVAGHRELLSKHGIRYVLDRERFVSHNTDGPGNPLSKVYSRGDAKRMFSPYFEDVKTQVRYLNLRLYPGGDRLSRSRVGHRLAQRIGWHLYLEGARR